MTQKYYIPNHNRHESLTSLHLQFALEMQHVLNVKPYGALVPVCEGVKYLSLSVVAHPKKKKKFTYT